MTPRLALLLILGVDAAILFYEASSLSLTYHGAQLLYQGRTSCMTDIIRASLALFGQHDLALRLPMILLNLLSAALLYIIAAPYAKHERERVWLVLIFVMLPGIISSSLLVDSAALVTFALFVYIYLRQRYGSWSDLVLPFYLLADPTFLALFLAMAFYGYRQRQYRLLGLYLLLFSFSLWHYGFNTGGIPENRFLDTLGIYAAVFSPIVFVYLAYVLYRRFITSETDLLWCLAATALVGSLLLSFRQRIEVEQFAPYLMVALPLGMQTFFHSYRVRLRPFRKRYRILFVLALLILVLNSAAVFFNKAFYTLLENPSEHFAYRAHIVKELSEALKERGIVCVDTGKDHKLQLRLRFYGIEKCHRWRLEKRTPESDKNVTISYYGSPVASFCVTKIPNN